LPGGSHPPNSHTPAIITRPGLHTLQASKLKCSGCLFTGSAHTGLDGGGSDIQVYRYSDATGLFTLSISGTKFEGERPSAWLGGG